MPGARQGSYQSASLSGRTQLGKVRFDNNNNNNNDDNNNNNNDDDDDDNNNNNDDAIERHIGDA